jgi:intein-encoded DNA endonuclease-like protein
MANNDNKVTKSELMTKIYSQASNDMVVPTYSDQENTKDSSARQIESAIIIKGGANVAFSDEAKTQRNVKWAVTEVSESELKTLEACKPFMRKVKAGFITVGKEPDLIKADKSSQMTEDQLKSKAPSAKAKTGPADE